MNAIAKLTGANQVLETATKAVGQESGKIGFKDKLSQVLEEINQLQLESGKMADKFVKGEIENIHDVMIAAEKASVSLELTLEVRNKLVEAYREIMRIQM